MLAPPEGGGLRPSWTAPPRATHGALMGRRAALGLRRPMRLDPIAINHLLAFPISEGARALRCSHHRGRVLTQGLQRAPLTAGQGGIRSLDQTQLLGRRVSAPAPWWNRLLRCAAGARRIFGSTLAGGLNRNLRWLGHSFGNHARLDQDHSFPSTKVGGPIEAHPLPSFRSRWVAGATSLSLRPSGAKPHPRRKPRILHILRKPPRLAAPMAETGYDGQPMGAEALRFSLMLFPGWVHRSPDCRLEAVAGTSPERPQRQIRQWRCLHDGDGLPDLDERVMEQRRCRAYRRRGLEEAELFVQREDRLR
jgi:hypothetical protein